MGEESPGEKSRIFRLIFRRRAFSILRLMDRKIDPRKILNVTFESHKLTCKIKEKKNGWRVPFARGQVDSPICQRIEQGTFRKLAMGFTRYVSQIGTFLDEKGIWKTKLFTQCPSGRFEGELKLYFDLKISEKNSPVFELRPVENRPFSGGWNILKEFGFFYHTVSRTNISFWSRISQMLFWKAIQPRICVVKMNRKKPCFQQAFVW